MADTVEVSLDFDISDFRQKLTEAKEGVVSLQEQLTNIPQENSFLDRGVQRTEDMIALLEERAKQFESGDTRSKNKTASDLQAGLEEVRASLSLFSDGGAFSATLAKQMFANFPDKVRQELSKATPALVSAIRQVARVAGDQHGITLDVVDLATNVVASESGKKIQKSLGKNVSDKDFRAYVQALAPNVTDLAIHGEYASMTGKRGRMFENARLEELVPQTFYQRTRQDGPGGWDAWGPYVRGKTRQRYLNQDAYEQLSAAISESDAMMRAAEQVPGMIQRNEKNHATLNKTISQDMLENMKERLWADFANRVSGKASKRIDLYAPDLSESDRRRLSSRAVSGSAGRVLSAMQNIADIEEKDEWSETEWSQGYGELKKEAKREKEQYEIPVVSVSGIKGGAEPKWVSLSESANTRLLGLSGHHNEQTDKVVIFSLEGYDRNDAQQKAEVSEILSGKPVELPGLPGKKYIAQSVHGTGADTSYKMVEETEYNRVRDQEAVFAEQAGLKGTNYWTGFLPEGYVFADKDPTNARAKYYKHQDGLAKGWSDSIPIQANLSAKSFGVVDMKSLGPDGQKLMDGLGVVMEGILPRGATQARFGVNNKGNLVQLRGRTLGEWAKENGLLDEKTGRFMVPGADGTMFDATDMHGLIDASQAKNLAAYGDTNDEINRAITLELQRYGINSMATFEDAQTSATSIGSQAAGFLKISPELRAAQAEEYARRKRLLETEAGVRQFILGNSDDPLAKMLRDGDIEVTDARIRQRVDNELETLTKRAAAGEWIDFSGDEIQNQMLSRNFVTALVEASLDPDDVVYRKDENGNVLLDENAEKVIDKVATRQAQIAKLRKNMTAAGVENAEYYDDEDIASIFTLDGSDAVVDFTHPDEEYVGMQRSPTAFGEFVYRKNYAHAAREVFEKMGLPTEGVYTTLSDAETLATADFDGDRVKTVYGRLAEVFRTTKAKQDELLKKVEGRYAKPIVTKDKGDGRTGYMDSPELRMTGIEARIDSVKDMATGSETAAKAASNDWEHDPKQVAAMVAGKVKYNAGTDKVKNLTEATSTKEAKEVNITTGRKSQNVSKDFSGVFDVSERDEDVRALSLMNLENPEVREHNGLFLASNGTIVDTEKLRDLQINRTSLPSVFQDSVIGGVASNLLAGASAPVLEKTQAIEEAYDNSIGYKDQYGLELGPIAKSVLQNVRRMHLETYAGERGMTTKEEEKILSAQLGSAEKEIEAEARSLGAKGIDGHKGFVRINGEVIPAAKFIDQRRKAAGLSVLREHLTYKGITETNLAKKRADDQMLIDAFSLQSTAGLRNTEILDPTKTVKPQLSQKGSSATTAQTSDAGSAVVNNVGKKATPEDMSYSYSMLNSFAETPTAWFNRYVKQNYQDTVTPEQALGTLTHKVAEIYGKDQIAAGGSGGARAGAEYQEIFHKLLSGDDAANKEFGLSEKEIETFAQLRDAVGYDSSTRKMDPLKASKGIINTFSGAKAFVKDLPEILKDYEVLGVETETTPDLGGVGENTGRVDMTLRDKNTGEVVSADIKKGLNQKTVKKAYEQQYLYSAKGGKINPANNAYEYADGVGVGERPVDRLMVLGYGTAHSGDVSKYVRETKFDEKEAQKVEAHYQKLKSQVVEYGHRGFDEEEIANSTYRMPTSQVKKTEKKKRKTTTKGSSQKGNVDSVKIDPDSGRQFAEQVSLQQDISDYYEQLNNLRGTLDSLGYRKEHPSTPNMWRKYQYQLEGGYAKQMEMFNAQGLDEDDPRRQQVAAMHQAASEEFDKALSISAVEDIVSATEDIQKSMTKDSVSGFATKFAKEFDTLTSSVEKARQALIMYAEQTDAIEQEYNNDAERGKDYDAVTKLANEKIAEAQARVGELESKSAAEPSSDQRAKYAEEISTLKDEIEENKFIAQKAEEAKKELNLGERQKNIESRKEVLSKANEANEEMNIAAMERLEQIRKQATSSTDAELQRLQHMADGTEYTPAEVAEMKKRELLENIKVAEATVNNLVERGAFSETKGAEYLSKIKAIDSDAYAKKIEEQLQFKKEQEKKSYKYKQEELARKREDEILTARERNEARMEGKPVDKRKQEERAYNARMAELEEQRRRLSDLSMSTSGASDEERTRAATEAGNLGKYIRDVQNVRDETLRTNAFADIRDLNTKLTEENKTRGVSREALEYAQQYKTLSESIEEATASYDELKKKIESDNYTKADADAETKARAQLEELQKNANAKREDLDKGVEESSSTRLDDLQRMALGKDLTPADIAKMRKESLKKQIDQYVADQRLIAGDENVGSATRSIAEIRATKAEKIDLDAYEQRILEQEELEREQRERQEQLRNERVKRNAEKQRKDPLGVRRNTWWGQVRETRDNARYQLEDSKAQLEAIAAQQRTKLSQTEVGTEEYKKLDAALKETESQIEETGAAAEKLDGPFGMAAAAAGKLAQSASNIALSLGKRVLSAALNEAKRFVVEWNASMTEIQMITGKTNEEINALSSNLASTAVDLRVSTSDVGSAAADLYRQGLSDEDVSTRLEDVIKFSKVANISTEEASEILTTAMSNGLVETTEEAMDAMVALGDSAATTASEISKGMKKSAAAAKEAGVSYEELLTMLTIITSKTQLGGANAGSALQMLFSRLYKMGNGEEVTDENGNRIFENSTTQALSRFGTSLFDENGNFRGAYDILLDIASGWGSAKEIDRELILDTLGAGRQRSNVATLFQGLAEDDGELASKYMDLASNSEGVTDEKYEAYYNNLAAAMNNVKTSFDQLVETFDFDDMAIGFLNFIADVIQGVTALGEATNNVLPVVLTLGGAIAGFAISGNPLGALIGGLAGFGVAGFIGSLYPEEEKQADGIKNQQEANATTFSTKEDTTGFIDRMEELNNKTHKTKEETAELEQGMAKLCTMFGITMTTANGVANSFDDVAKAIEEARAAAEKMTVQELRFNLESNIADIYDQAKAETTDLGATGRKEMREHIESIAQQTADSVPENFDFSAYGLIPKDFVDFMKTDGEFLGLLQKFGMNAAKLNSAESVIDFFNNADTRNAWAGDPEVRQVLAANGYLNKETNEVDVDRAAIEFQQQAYGIFFKNFDNYEDYVKQQNKNSWASYLKQAVITALAGNTDMSDEEIEQYADVFSTNAASEIMGAGDYKAQTEKAWGIYSNLGNTIFDEYEGYQEKDHFSNYVDDNNRVWYVETPDGTRVGNLTKTEADELFRITYGTKTAVQDQNGNTLQVFDSEDAASAFLTNSRTEAEELEVIPTEVYTLSEEEKKNASVEFEDRYGRLFDANGNPVDNASSILLNGYDEDLGYTGTYPELWNKLKNNILYWGADAGLALSLTPTERDSNPGFEQMKKGFQKVKEQFYKGIEEKEDRYIYDGKTYVDSADAFAAQTSNKKYWRNAFIRQITVDDLDQLKDEVSNKIGRTDEIEEQSDVVPQIFTRMNKLMENIDSSRLTYEYENQGKLSADKAFEQIVAAGITSVDALGKAIDDDLIESLDNAAAQIPELGTALTRIFEINEDGSWSIKEGTTDADVSYVLSLLAKGSLSYTTVGQMTQEEETTRQNKIISDSLDGSKIDSTAAGVLSTVLGNDLATKILRASGDVVTFEEYKKNSPEATEEDYEKDVKIQRRGNIDAVLSDNEKAYIQTLQTNATYGVDGLLDSQKIGYRQQFANALMNHDGKGVSALDESMRSVYTNGDSTNEMLWAASAALNEKGLDFDNLNWWSSGYEDAVAVLETLGLTAEQVKKAVGDLNDELGVEGIRNSQKYKEQTEDVISTMSQWGKTAKKAASGLKTLNSAIVEAQNNQYYRDKYRSGARDDETVKAIAEQTGFDESDVKEGKQSVKDMLDITEAADLEELNNQIDALNEFSKQNITLTGPNITMESGSVDIATALSSMTDQASAELLASYNSLIESGYEVKLETYQKGTAADGSAIFGARIVPITNNIKSIKGKKKSGGGGGGGGGGKSAGKKLIEEQDHETTLREHIIKMIQYEETRYQNADELTNYGIMLQHEIDEEERQTKVIEKNIEALKNQLAQTSKGSDDWYELREAILKAEESLSEMNNTIDENKKKLKENEQAILKLHTDLEQEVKGEIETRIQEERDMLDGQVSMEQTILDAIKNRYEKEWELMQKDIDKKKKALQEEMDLIDERLQRRKDAEDEAEKYEELAEYKRQLALISTDSTRTKDQAALKEKIADLEKELAWDKAEEEADLQKEGIQDQIDAYDQYTEDYQEYLDDLLENANNFADEVNSVMQMSHEDMIAWLQKNVEEYTNSLESSQKQMTQGWDDTFKQMKGIIDTFWAEIAQTLSSKYNFLAYMHNSSAYQNASEDEKKQMDYNWGTMYDSWISAKKESEEAKNYKHEDETLNGNGGGSNTGSATGKYVASAKANGKMLLTERIYKNKKEARDAALRWIERQFASEYNGLDDVKDAATISSIDAKVIAAKNSISVYKEGGLVDYTGPAWVDGTKSRPEAFLSADDTQMIRTLIDGWKYVAMQPTVTNVDGLLGRGSSNTIGQVNVTLNEAQFNTDEDYELVAQKVGEAFTKELAKTGFKTASFAF